MTKKEIHTTKSAAGDDMYRHMQLRMALQSTVCFIVTLAATAILAANLWFPIVQVFGNSMSPTLHTGDVLLCVKTDALEQGDIAAFYHNNKLLIKRVIGCEGNEVSIDASGTVLLNQQAVLEPYVSSPAQGQIDIALPCRVPAGHFFMMGDARATSLDSRSEVIGCVPEDRVLGKVLFRIWPLTRIGPVFEKGGAVSHVS